MRNTPPPTLSRDFPSAVIALANCCGANTSSPRADHVVLTQAGVMRADAAHRWAPFHARQSIALDRVAFSWKAATGPLGCITVTDALEETGPRLTVIALGLIPLARVARNDALRKGELQRYLAEIPLYPDAILRNAALGWEVLDPATLRVSASHGGVSAHVDLTLGTDGLVTSAFANRPRLEGAAMIERPWTGRFSDYRTQRGRRIPFAADVAWRLCGEDFACWSSNIRAWGFGDRQ